MSAESADKGRLLRQSCLAALQDSDLVVVIVRQILYEINMCTSRLIVAPNGVAYAPPEARPGVLPRMLAEILGTRIMVRLQLSLLCCLTCPRFQLHFAGVGIVLQLAGCNQRSTSLQPLHMCTVRSRTIMFLGL